MGPVGLNPEGSVRIPHQLFSKALEINFKCLGWGVDLPRVGGDIDALRIDPEVPSNHLRNYFQKHLKLISNASAGVWISHAWEGM